MVVSSDELMDFLKFVFEEEVVLGLLNGLGK